MKRDLTASLVDWLNSSDRKPLVIRGARQVGKTWLVQDLAIMENRQLIELNFEKRPEFKALFSSNDPKEILQSIEGFLEIKIEPLTSILFLDEIQAAPHLLAKLRWFAEDMPELAVVAAGSLLDFALAKHEFSMPVGRIGYFYLEPLSFEEFLDATGREQLRTYIQNYNWNTTILELMHDKFIKLIKEYLIIGGMPAAVANWASQKVPEKVNKIHFDLLATYRDDFTKYSGYLSTERLEDVMSSVPLQLGHKFVYKEANADVSSASLKQALKLLSKARICHQIKATSANGLPLAAEADDRFLKVIMLDCGLTNAALKLSLYELDSVSDLSIVNRGGMAEQLVGQLLRTLDPPYVPPELYYWQRGKKEGEAEVDYVIQHGSQVIPVEVKAGTTGTLRSLHEFMKKKKRKVALRINSDLPTWGPVNIKDPDGSSIEYTLLSIPFYLIGQFHRLVKQLDKGLFL